MAHLGDRVAAFVDGQLSEDEHQTAVDHLDTCAECQSAVRQQRLVKHRMTGLDDIAPPPSLLSSLADPVRMCSETKRSTLARLLRLPGLRAFVALTGATVTITVLAYAVGPPAPDEDESVTPPVDEFVSQYASESAPLRPVGVTSRQEALGVRQVSAQVGATAERGDSARALRLLRGVAGPRGKQTLTLLRRNFDLSVGGRSSIDGRPAIEVVAGRGGRVAASYWVDASTGVLLRRVAYDRDGMPIAQSDRDDYELMSVSRARGSGAVPVASAPIEQSTMHALSGSGWPCHDALSGGFERIASTWTDDRAERVVTLTYTDGVSTLTLYEQSGALDKESLTSTADGSAQESFEKQTLAGANVWVREGSPTVATWDDAGVVYTVVTDAGRRQLAEAVRDLPRTPARSGMLDRVSGGIERLSGWVTPVGAA